MEARDDFIVYSNARSSGAALLTKPVTLNWFQGLTIRALDQQQKQHYRETNKGYTMISVNFNPSVLTSQRNLNNSTNYLNNSLERMSTGYKVNCAADDAAGMFVSSRLNASLRGLAQAKKNVADGISLINTADGALSNMSDLLNR